ncbi:MAG: hypothetical protein HN712_21205 [Gemmatimonadetes bacterium]|jgi:hypothetical protein|nr:hypothetical protein [Gemmatimonadota bacterium]MBT6144184.1 hypothetical protein [Gemmatimonadota bacterium]MBT7862847.1 hypothetical protein [Gemmatimonadota bacterium]
MVTLNRLKACGWTWALLAMWTLSIPQAVAADVAAELDSLRVQASWGELAFGNGQIRQVKVDAVEDGQVMLTEVIGALHVRPATYSLNEVQSVRVLGPRRIQPRMSPRQGATSLPLVLGMELLIPGAGYFQMGEGGKGLRILLASAALGATAMASGEDTAAAWIPLGVWLKLYSLGHLADEVRADQALQDARTRRLSASLMAPVSSTPTVLALRWHR